MAAALKDRLTPFERLGGAVVLERIVERFYDLMESDQAYAELRAMHAADLAPMRRSLAGVLTAWSGGPRNWFVENPGKCMMSVHGGLPIDAQTAGQWSAAMQRAIADVAPGDRETAELFAGRLDQIARAMARIG